MRTYVEVCIQLIPRLFFRYFKIRVAIPKHFIPVPDSVTFIEWEQASKAVREGGEQLVKQYAKEERN